jgi:nickel-dependent lactate racemase
MKIELPYGSENVSAELDWGDCLGTLDIADTPELPDLERSIDRTLRSPIGLDFHLFDTVAPGETVAIIVSDAFRKTAINRVLPVLIAGLREEGIREEDIRFIFATGTHRAPTPEEQAEILGARMYKRFEARLFVHDAHDEANCEPVGTTSRGTPVKINKRALECDRIITTGAVVFHYFGGFGGGRKSIVPGISSVETISHNHAMNLDPREDRLNPDVRIGVLEGNPVAEDMLEAAHFVNVDYTICTVLNRQGQIAGLFSGELDAAHRAAAGFARQLYAVPIERHADLVVASSGPTRNFVQSHKALYNAYQAVRPNGRIVLLARCEEGLGGEQFQKWVRLGGPRDVIAGLRRQSEINGQTALSTLGKGPITVLVTDMPEADVVLLKARKAVDLAEALTIARDALAHAGTDSPTYYVMPSAAYTVPFLASGA